MVQLLDIEELEQFRVRRRRLTLTALLRPFQLGVLMQLMFYCCSEICLQGVIARRFKHSYVGSGDRADDVILGHYRISLDMPPEFSERAHDLLRTVGYNVHEGNV